MDQKIRWGVLSTAHIAEGQVIPAIQQSNNGVMTAVASRDLSKAQAFAARCGIPHAYGSYDELIADPDVDAIYNPLPNGLHAEWSIKCAEGGKPVLCEKPLASDAAEAQQMIDAFQQRGILLAEAFMYRFHPQIDRLKQLIADGVVGQLQVMQGVFSFAISDESNVRLNKDLIGGALMDVGCYPVSLIRYVAGEEPSEVSALANFGAQSGVDETLIGLLRFPGVLAHFDCSLRAETANTFEVRGSAGRILLERAYTPFRPDPTAASTIRCWHGGDYEEIVIPPTDPYTLMAEDFADALLNQRPPRFPIADSIAQMRVLDRLYAAAGRR